MKEEADPLVRGSDPGIRTKMSRIPNAEQKRKYFFHKKKFHNKISW